MLSRFFKSKETEEIKQTLDSISNSLLQISSHLKLKDEADKKNVKTIMNKIDGIVAEQENDLEYYNIPENWKAEIDKKVFELSKAGQGNYAQVRHTIANLFKKETGVDLFEERDRLRELRKKELMEKGAMSKFGIKRITVSNALSNNVKYLKTYIDIVNREHDKHAKGN